MDFNGFILVDKPLEWTSFDVVAKIRGILKHSTGKKIKVGHTGTLDPLATGLLIIVVGSYCKRAEEFSKLDKSYEATLKLGENSTTGDAEGKKTAIFDSKPSAEQILEALEAFKGEIMQKPPLYSAIKINGQRAYKMARKGDETKLEPRKVRIISLKLKEYDYPYVKISTKVGSGTYIRSLAEDIGAKLGTGAYVKDLKRTEVGKFKLADAQIDPKTVTAEEIYRQLKSE